MKKLSKKETENRIEDFFSDIKNKTYLEIQKIIKLSMKSKIKLGDKRKLFCRECFNPYRSPKVRINNSIKSVECENCGYKSRWKIKPS
jgi:RNase P subunit RPR2